MQPDPDFVPFETLDHTADLAFLVRGRTLDELFHNAAVGMTHFLYETDSVRPDADTLVALEGTDLEELLVAWLQEILYLIEVRRQVFRGFARVAVRPPAAGEPARLTAVAQGEAWDPARHTRLGEVKAATYHGLAIVRERGRGGGEIYCVRIVLDT